MDLVLEETKEEMMDMIDLGSTYFMLYFFFCQSQFVYFISLLNLNFIINRSDRPRSPEGGRGM